jgi:hypothetical protein
VSPTLKYATLGETALYKRLGEVLRDSEDGETALLLGDVTRICGDAAQRMKRMQALHKQYTLHD